MERGLIYSVAAGGGHIEHIKRFTSFSLAYTATVLDGGGVGNDIRTKLNSFPPHPVGILRK